ncbi:MAG: hypothetical protein RSD36_16485 [Terrisporobacter sp.]
MNSKIYYINSVKRIMFYDDDIVFLKSLISIYTLNGKNIALLVKDIISQFEHGSSILTAKEILSNKYTIKSIDKIIDTFLHKQILTEFKNENLTDDIKFISEFKGDLSQLNSLSKNIKLGIISSYSMVDDILSILDDVSFINNINLLNVDCNTQKSIYRDYSNINIKSFNNDKDKSTQIYDLLNESTFIIVSLDEFNDILLDEINNFSIELRKPWLKSVINNIKGEIGPLIIPKKTPCYECYKSRCSDNILDKNLIIFNQIKKDFYPIESGYLPSFIKVNIGILMTEAIKYLSDIECELKGNILNINYLTYETSIHPLIKVHNCRCQE